MGKGAFPLSHIPVKKHQRPERDSNGFALSPVYPAIVLDIVKLRDIQKLSFDEIGEKIGMTHAGAAKQYSKWREWAIIQNKLK